ncbi:MAG TPA: trypsin-like peptidase domain-containing protein [Elusimicrobiota bacterium]|nr:trypsin-like peptidase domain-containing protein [Elusimicrobiota bacterium]
MKIKRLASGLTRTAAAGLSLFLVLASLPPQALVFAQDVPIESVPQAESAPGANAVGLGNQVSIPVGAAEDFLSNGAGLGSLSNVAAELSGPAEASAALPRQAPAQSVKPEANVQGPVSTPISASADREAAPAPSAAAAQPAAPAAASGSSAQRLKARVSRFLGKAKFKSGALAKGSAAELAAQGAARFDGQASAATFVEPARAGKSGFWTHSLGRPGSLKPSKALGSKIAAPFSRLRRVPKALTRRAADFAYRHRPFAGELDEYGGPSHRPMKFATRLAYGFKWGVNLFGLTTIAGYVLRPFLSGLTTGLPSSLLGLFGRVELMASLGPKAIAQGLASAPWHLLFVQAPFLSLYEEAQYRGFDFGFAFLGLIVASKILSTTAKNLESIPDFAGIRVRTQRTLTGLSKVSKVAFPAAAIFSAGAFALAHFATWGFNPASAALWFLSGAVLAAVAYRTRGLAAPIVAHLTYNLLGLIGGLLALHYFMPMASEIARLLLATISVASLLLTYRSYRAARKARQSPDKAPARASFLRRAVKTLGAAALVAVLALGPILNSARQTTTVEYSAQAQTVPAKKAQASALAELQNLGIPSGAEAQAGQTGASAMTVAEITHRVKPAVVMIVVKQPIGAVEQLWMRSRKWLGLSVPTRFMEAIGSGSILTPQGLVVTNGHVVQMAGVGGTVMVVLSNGKQYKAKVLTFSAPERKDIAFLQLPDIGAPWPTVPIGNSAALKEGDRVIAMGHPLGLPFTVSQGVVSGLKDPDGVEPRGELYHDMIQTDAPITHGNSGGPLLNQEGEQIGINTAGVDAGGNIGFAIPMNDVLAALGEFAKTGNVDASWMGIVVDGTNPSAPAQGLAVESVRYGSPAAKAGIASGDIILGAILNGHQIAFPAFPGSLMFMQKILALSNPGESIQLIVNHQDQIKTVKVTTASAEKSMK